ncbi:helix-turn-helix transcriptional regulator [Kitasatospora cineracea]
MNALAALSPAIPLSIGNDLLALSRTAGYRMVNEGTYPCTVFKAGDQHRVVTADLLGILGLPDLHIRQRMARLPPAIRLSEANDLLSLSRTTGYKLARNGQYPCHVLRLGTEYRVRKHELQRLLHIGDVSSGRAAA